MEAEALLIENNVYSTDFSEKAILELKDIKEACNEKGEYVIP